MSLTILYIEDDKTISGPVAEILGCEGWRVEVCADGLTALALIEGGTHYDLIILDNELPRMKGVELARRARLTAHHARTPIVMLSASDVEADAGNAGADLFLRKPHDIGLIVGTVRGLVER